MEKMEYKGFSFTKVNEVKEVKLYSSDDDEDACAIIVKDGEILFELQAVSCGGYGFIETDILSRIEEEEEE